MLLYFQECMEQDILNFQILYLDLSSRKLFIEKKCIFLRNKEFSLLEYFVRHVGKVLSRTQLLEDVWDKDIFCPTNTIDVHVSSLRRKLRRYRCANFIKTVHCIGYIFEP